jgi:hypothetical protein
LEVSRYLPYCNLNKAQFSFHGHRDAVRFFLHVAGKGLHKSDVNSDSCQSSKLSNTMLVLSGGQGYVDFRVSDNANDANDVNSQHQKNASTSSKIDKNYLIVWQI